MSEVTTKKRSNGNWRSNPERMDKVRSAMYEQQKGRCCYCEKLMRYPIVGHHYKRQPADLATFEHLQQRCEGGTWAQKNIRLACQHCNKNRPNSVCWVLYKSFKMGEISSQEMYALATDVRIGLQQKGIVVHAGRGKVGENMLRDADGFRQRADAIRVACIG